MKSFPIILVFAFIVCLLLAFYPDIILSNQCIPVCVNYTILYLLLLVLLTKYVFLNKIVGMKYSVFKIIELVVVNFITMIRLIGAIILPIIYVKYGASICAIWTIVLFATDAIDGFLARKLKISTFFGSAMDGISDKLLNAISFIILGLQYNIMIPPLILEIAIMSTLYSTYRFGGNIQSSKTGKIKTVILDVCVILSFTLMSLPALNIDNSIINHLIHYTNTYIVLLGCIITIASIVTLIDYNKKNKNTRNNKKLTHIKYQHRIKKNMKEVLSDLFDTDYYIKHKNEPIMKQFYKTKVAK